MKVQVFLPATIILCAVLVILIKVRQDERGKEEKRALFLEIKVRVSDDVLRDYANEKVVLRQSFNTAKDEYKTTDKGKKETEEAADAVTLEAQKCEADQKSIKDELGKLEEEHTNLKAESAGPENLRTELEALKKQLRKISPVCAFITNITEASHLCSETVKAEEPKKDEAEQDAPAETTTESKKEEAAATEAPK